MILRKMKPSIRKFVSVFLIISIVIPLGICILFRHDTLSPEFEDLLRPGMSADALYYCSGGEPYYDRPFIWQIIWQYPAKYDLGDGRTARITYTGQGDSERIESVTISSRLGSETYNSFKDSLPIDDFTIHAGLLALAPYNTFIESDWMTAFGSPITVMDRETGVNATGIARTVRYSDLELHLLASTPITESSQWELMSLDVITDQYPTARGLKVGMKYSELVTMFASTSFLITPYFDDDSPTISELHMIDVYKYDDDGYVLRIALRATIEDGIVVDYEIMTISP